MKSNSYQSGFGNEFATEAVAGALPVGRNSPQRVAHGLYAEQLSGTAFTAPRGENRRSWLYRIRPAAMHGTFSPYAAPADTPRFHNDFGQGPVTPDQLRWSPLPLPSEDAGAPVDCVDGLFTMAGNGSPAAQHGVGIHLYAANADMQGHLSGSWSTGAGQGFARGGRYPGHIELNGTVVHGVATRVARYLPLGLPDDTRSYVSRAVLGGSVHDLGVRVRGDLWDFPFHRVRNPKDGEFRIAGRVEDLSFAYVPGTPASGAQPAAASPWPFGPAK